MRLGSLPRRVGRATGEPHQERAVGLARGSTHPAKRLLRLVGVVLIYSALLAAGKLGFGSLIAHFGFHRVAGATFGLAVLAFLLQGVFSYIVMLRQKVAQLEKLVRIDDLTGLENARSFRETFARRGSGLILFDIDQFKPYNDTHGHPAGDEVLRQLGQILQGEPTVYRLGGDEFAVIVADPDGRVSAELAEFLWLKIRDHPWPLRPITASFGVAWMLPTFDPTLIRNRADQALYRAKREGGDRICVYSEPGTG